MKTSTLRNKTASGFAYKFAERVGAQGINFFLQLLLARLLLPEDYGLVALVAVFIIICDVFVTYGFSSALIANKHSDSTDFSTCFYFSMALALLLYTGVFFAAPWVEEWYGMRNLCAVLRVMALRIPLAAVNSVQHAYVQKHMWFRKFFHATLIGTIVSGTIAAVMAWRGFGVWALVEQYLGNVVMDTVCLWVIVGWRPTLEFSWKRLKAIYDYGWKILAVGLIDNVYSRLRSLIIGKRFSGADLAFYSRGYAFPSFGMRLIEPTVNSVLFPALSQCNDNPDQMRAITKRVLKVSTFLISPLMVGLAVVGEPLVRVLLTDKWLPCVPFLQIGCIANLFRCQQFINNNVIKSSGRSGLLLKLDILKKAIGLALILISMQFGVIWIAWSLVAVYFISMVINVAPNRKILRYGYGEQFRDVGGNLLPALLMGACIHPLSFLALPPLQQLLLQLPAGLAAYAALSWLLRNDSFRFLWRQALNWRNRAKAGNRNERESE